MSVGQADFAAALMSPEADAPRGLSGPDGRAAGRRFDVYRNNVVASLTGALETAFPVVRKLVGETNFRVLAGAFLRVHPPRTPVLMLYGRKMPEFLETFAPARPLGYLPDVARLEQALRESYHDADAAAADPARLGALSPDDLTTARLGLAPALRIVRSRWPVHAIWRYNVVPGAPKPGPGSEDVAILRPGHDPEPVLLPPGGAAFVAAIGGGMSLGAADDAARAEAPGFELATVLGLLLSYGTITDIMHGEHQP